MGDYFRSRREAPPRGSAFTIKRAPAARTKRRGSLDAAAVSSFHAPGGCRMNHRLQRRARDGTTHRDGLGMEELVAKIRSLEREQSVIRWVCAVGAVYRLYFNNRPGSMVLTFFRRWKG